MARMRDLDKQLRPDDWSPDSLFSEAGRMAGLFGVMLKIPQLKQQLEEIGGNGFDYAHLSNITRDWINGARLEDIARAYFSHEADRSETEAFTDACKAIYRAIVNNGTWGVSTLSRVSGMDFDAMTEVERRRINALPAMIACASSAGHGRGAGVDRQEAS